MKLIDSSVEIIPQEAGLQGIYKQIEKCGRTCYKSEDKITNDSAKSFVDRMINSGHTATLEQSAVYLKVPKYEISGRIINAGYEWHKFVHNPYSYFNVDDPEYIYISTNLRVLYDWALLQLLDYVVDPSNEDFRNQLYQKRITVKFVCDRGVSHELVRHRTMSFMQESTRYCNYSKDKFDNEVTFIIPTWLTLNTGKYDSLDKNYEIQIVGDGLIKDYFGKDKESVFLRHCLDSEGDYFNLLNEGCTPQEARQVLPNALKTEICVTGFVDDWKHFFELRFFGYTGKPHPDMHKLATELFFKMIHELNYSTQELNKMIDKGFSDVAEKFSSNV